MISIEQVSGRDYRRAFPQPAVVYNSVEFTELNACRADRVDRYAIFDASANPLAGLTVGRVGGSLRAPFSAPFAMLDFNRQHRAETMVEVGRLLREALPGLELTLPPAPYYQSMNAKTMMGILAAGGRMMHCDWNYHLDLSRDFEADLSSANRNKLRRAERAGLLLRPAEAAEAYEIIRRNREHKGYRLAMSQEQVLQTVKVVEADFFVLTDAEGRPQASAMVYRPAPGIAQLIYWGDLPKATARNCMTVMGARLAAHYRALGMRIFDLGPTGGEGLPNPG
ncbi:MAG: hypothetical protein K2N10_04465, partial [Muribaculaceae bacterium]|nr:hypothetical protein [Muribaculaceae bacterium]